MVLGQTTDAGVIGLEAGDVAIEGRISLPFEHAGYPMIVRACLGGPFRDDTYEPRECFEGRHQEAHVGEDDVFRLTGLARGTWRLQLECVGKNLSVVAQPELDVPAPSQGIVIGPGIGRVIVATQVHGAPLPGVTVMLRCGSASDGSEGLGGFPGEFPADMREQSGRVDVDISAFDV